MAAIPAIPRLDTASWSFHPESTTSTEQQEQQDQLPSTCCQFHFTSVILVTPPVTPLSHTFTARPDALDNDMSSATTTALEQPSSSTSVPSTHTTRCQQCGANLSHTPGDTSARDASAQSRIAELEQQVKVLTGKATAAGTFSCRPPGACTSSYTIHNH